MRVKVSQSCIDCSHAGDSNGYCPIERALLEAGIEQPSVGVRRIFGMLGGTHIKYITSERIVKFVKDFDGGRKVAPFNFNLGSLTALHERG